MNVSTCGIPKVVNVLMKVSIFGILNIRISVLRAQILL